MTKKWTIWLLVAAVLLLPAGAFAAQTEAKGDFGTLSGVVTEIRADEASGLTYVTLTKDDQSVAVLIVSKDTYVAGGEPAVGDAVAGWYDLNAPMTMIYPPQYSAVAVADKLPEGVSLKVDRFDADLLSSDGQLKLNVADGMPVENRDGTAFTGELGGCVLAVYYSATTRSIPAQATPSRIVVIAQAETKAPEQPAVEPASEGGATVAPVG